MIRNSNDGFGNDYHTEILVHSKGADGSTSFVDYSYRSASIINLSDFVTNSNIQQKFAQTSIHLDGGPLVYDEYLAASLSQSINRKDFCIDFWINMDDDAGKPFTDYLYCGFFKTTGIKPVMPDFNNYCGVRIDNAYSGLYFEYISGGTTYFRIGGTVFNYSVDTWYHISAIRYDTSQLLLFIDGRLVDSGNIAGYSSTNVKNLDYHVLTLHRSATTTLRNFYLDEWRHSIGHMRWNKNFIVPNRAY